MSRNDFLSHGASFNKKYGGARRAGAGPHVAGAVHVAGERAARRTLAATCPARISAIPPRTAPGSVASSSTVTIELATEARPRCWPSRRLDRHGYIDMGIDSMGPPPLQPFVSQERCFLTPPAPAQPCRHGASRFSGTPTLA
ncbi:unnamed protein product [Colias eurytheme]|nr:unnamed protein product [Colias eurytheme]